VLLAEAGTGTGKTQAYLTAAIASDRRVVISTGTRTLQDQIVNNDIPTLEASLGTSLDAVCLKGLSNYVCRRRLEEATSLMVLDLDDTDRVEALEMIRRWAETSETGDRAELADLAEDHPLWQELCSDVDGRLGPRCRHYEECFVTRARKAAEEARLVIVNHHLLLADLSLKAEAKGVLPSYDALILDEAHLVDSIATELFGVRVSRTRIERISHDSRQALDRDRPGGEGDPEALIVTVRHDSRMLFGLVASALESGESRATLAPGDVTDEIEAAYWRLDSSLEVLATRLDSRPASDEASRICFGRVEGLRADLSDILGTQVSSKVYWKQRTPTSACLGMSPVDVSALIRERVFYEVESVVLTSATLTAAGSFSYLRERLGIDFDAAELSVPSPFDFRRHAGLYLPDNAPDPRQEGFVDEVVDILEETIPTVAGGALVLFTSYRDLHAAAAKLRGRLDRPIRVQGERPRHLLLEEMREAPRGQGLVLLATSSFWQGVDVPGEALELVVIAKLPFASPSDPIVSARVRLLTEQGRNAFEEYQVPQAALALKQGFGRLIRSRTDRGIVAILDRRVTKMRYGKAFLDSLPRCTTFHDAEELRSWWSQG